MTPIEDSGIVGKMFTFQNNKIYAYCSFDTVRNIYREIIAENQFQLIEQTVGSKKIGESLKDRFNILRQKDNRNKAFLRHDGSKSLKISEKNRDFLSSYQKPSNSIFKKD